jgi:predicted ArsR family transcriptional regulator
MLASSMRACSLAFGTLAVAAILHIRESTVKFHLSNIFAKGNVRSRRDLFSSPVASELPFRRSR